MITGPIDCGTQHRGPTDGVNGDESDAQCCGGTHTTGNRVWDVVVLEVEKDFRAARLNFTNHRGSGRREKLSADLKKATCLAKIVNQIERRF